MDTEWEEIADPYLYDYTWAEEDEQAMSENWLEIERLGKLLSSGQKEWGTMLQSKEEEN
jgi:hypothetical protein